MPLSEHALFIVSILGALAANYFIWFRGLRRNRQCAAPQGCLAAFVKPLLDRYRMISALAVLGVLVILYISEIARKGI
jgi:hypothetical protein